MRTLKGSVGSDHLCQGAQIGPCKPVCFTLQRALVWDLRITLTTAQVSEMLVHSFRDACPCWVLRQPSPTRSSHTPPASASERLKWAQCSEADRQVT